jgi:hypothetical protein
MSALSASANPSTAHNMPLFLSLYGTGETALEGTKSPTSALLHPPHPPLPSELSQRRQEPTALEIWREARVAFAQSSWVDFEKLYTDLFINAQSTPLAGLRHVRLAAVANTENEQKVITDYLEDQPHIARILQEIPYKVMVLIGSPTLLRVERPGGRIEHSVAENMFFDAAKQPFAVIAFQSGMRDSNQGLRPQTSIRMVENEFRETVAKLLGVTSETGCREAMSLAVSVLYEKGVLDELPRGPDGSYNVSSIQSTYTDFSNNLLSSSYSDVAKKYESDPADVLVHTALMNEALVGLLPRSDGDVGLGVVPIELNDQRGYTYELRVSTPEKPITFARLRDIM